MTDRPIIYSREMVRALLAFRKTQTRRLATSPLRLTRPGDRLWVRERYCRGPGDAVWYEADGEIDLPPANWIAAMLMPRVVSRVTLLVEEVRFQHAHDITAVDVLAEGVTAPVDHDSPMLPLDLAPPAVTVDQYAELWDRLHGAGHWHLNPPVVAVTFSVTRGNIDRL